MQVNLAKAIGSILKEKMFVRYQKWRAIAFGIEQQRTRETQCDLVFNVSLLRRWHPFPCKRDTFENVAEVVIRKRVDLWIERTACFPELHAFVVAKCSKTASASLRAAVRL